jgi:hypothetical protein
MENAMGEDPSGRAAARADDTGRGDGGRFLPGRTPANRIAFTAAATERIRVSYAESDMSLSAIARDAGTSASTIRRLAAENGWTRPAPPPRDVSPADQLAEKTRKLRERAQQDPPPDLGALVDDLVRQLQAQLARLASARSAGVPNGWRDERRTTHDLTALKNAVQDLMHLRAQQKEPVHAADADRPTDIDARRDALTRRIEAFMESRTDEECGLGPDGNAVERA